MDSLVSGERVLEVLETAPRVRDFRGAIFAPRFRGEIVFDRVTFGHQQGRPVVQDLSFRIAPGENVGLIGESGSGKSTILSLLLRFHDPWQGRILIDGNDIRNYKVHSLREQIGVVLQESFLFRRSVFENIQYGKNGANRREILTAAEAAQADGFIKRLPQGYDTVLDELGSNLSGGQRQRIALARAFLRDAPILLLDEPTNGLDNATEAELVQTMNDLARRKTTITVAHRLSTLEFCDRVFVLDHGKIVQQGRYKDRKIL
jgi:ABC-type multidrug transport system fused ATPase/permease subunit